MKRRNVAKFNILYDSFSQLTFTIGCHKLIIISKFIIYVSFGAAWNS